MIALLLMSFTAMATQPSGPQTVYVPFCEIVQNHERYDERRVVTSGIFTAGREFSSFADLSCAPGPELDVATFPTPMDTSVQRSTRWREMRRILDRDGRVFVVVRGVFDAYRRYEGPLPDDPRLQEILKKGDSRFGHLNFARFQLRIESVEFVAPVAPE